MNRSSIRLTVSIVFLATCVGPILFHEANAAQRTWIGGNVDWVDGGATANWTPADEPDIDDEAIFNTANTVNLGTDNSIMALTLSGGIDLNTNDFDLTVVELVQLVDANTNLFVGGSASTLTARNVTINNAADLEVNGGVLGVGGVPAAGFGVLDINAGGELLGHGTVNLTEVLVGSETLLVNDGAISAQSTPFIIFGEPPVGTLSINSTDTDARIDLDGTGENGVLNVFRSQTLDINVAPIEVFDGDLNLFHNSTFDWSSAWTLASGTIDVNNGFINGVFPNPDVPAGVSIIDGGTLTQTGGTITVIDTDGTLQFDAPFTMNGGTFVNEGHTIFNANATINAAATFTVGLTGSDLTVGANAAVLIDQASFNLDGNAPGTVITVNEGGTLTLDLGDYDNDVVTNGFDATITLNSGSILVNTADAEFVMDGTLNMNKATTVPEWDGEPLDIGNDAGVLDAKLNIGGAGNSIIRAQVDFNSDADVDFAAGSSLILTNTVNFNPVNGGNNAQFTGAGTIAVNGQVNFNEATTFNMTGGTVDFDGLETSNGDTVNVDAPVTVNAATMSSFGKVNTAGVNTLDVNNNVVTGVLTVNLDNAADEWTLNGPGVMNLVNDNTDATLLAGSDVNINGTVNVTGDVRTTARLDIAGIVNINTAGQPLRLAGGTLGDPNMLNGGTISGAGALGADSGIALHGHGTINTGIDFDGASNLFADDGTLTINGSILDVSRIGTDDVDGVLNVVNPWNTSVASFVTLDGGTIQGGTMTIDNVNAVSGFGAIASRVINNVRISASGGTLVVQTAGNDNDWDGAANDASLNTQPDSTLELRDNATFGFTGVVSTFTGGRVFANGFALDFNPGSILALGAGTYESTHSTDIGGTVIVNIDESIIKVANNFFLTFETGSATTLNANLRLENNNINIEAGATFSGAGALAIVDGSHLVADNLANIGVLLEMQGAFRPGNSEGIGRVDLFDYQQANTGELFVELTGTSLNQFDRLVASGDVVLGGYLNIDIDGGFVPALGNMFNIITANTVSGQFDDSDVVGVPTGLTFHINYLGNAVQLKAVASGDLNLDGSFTCADVDALVAQIASGIDLSTFDLNGDTQVDAADLSVWLARAGDANLPSGNPYLPGDANLDGVVDGSDFGIWNSNKFTSAAAWCRGDFNTDGVVDGSDFGIWNANKFTSSDGTSAVPEPGYLALLFPAWILLAVRRLQRRA